MLAQALPYREPLEEEVQVGVSTGVSPCTQRQAGRMGMV